MITRATIRYLRLHLLIYRTGYIDFEQTDFYLPQERIELKSKAHLVKGVIFIMVEIQLVLARKRYHKALVLVTVLSVGIPNDIRMIFFFTRSVDPPDTFFHETLNYLKTINLEVRMVQRS